MLISLFALTALWALPALSHLTDAASNAATASPIEYALHRPEDPSTLTLALIGAATLAVYFGSRRAVRARRPALLGESRASQFASMAGADVQATADFGDEPSRGAA
jgi:hypothetical protein